MNKITLAVPSKGRLMEQTTEKFAAHGLVVRKTGDERGYQGEIDGWPNIEVAFVSASEIAQSLKSGSIQLGITGEDLVRESMSDYETRIRMMSKLGIGKADVVVAVPNFWLDVSTVADLEDMAMPFRRAHGRWPRVATKYLNITRRFFAERGFGDYRIVESLGATEGAPSSGTAELIVDITSTGATLRANGLRVLDDGVILRSEANLVASNVAEWDSDTRAVAEKLAACLS